MTDPLHRDLPIIDVHCHLSSPAFGQDLDAVLGRAAAAGVVRMISMGENAADNRQVLDLAERHAPQVTAALGHYPDQLTDEQAQENEQLIREARAAGRLVAIGEVGIDHWLAAKGSPEQEAQHRHFRRFVALGAELDLPLSVHSRSAGHHAIALLRDAGARRVCLHAFGGKARYVAEGLAAGYYFSIPPSVLVSVQKQKLVRALPLDRLLLESDAPVLGPDPGQRNEPANIRRAVTFIGELLGVPERDVLGAAAENTAALFGRDLLP